MKRCLKTRILPFVCLVVLLITSLVVPIGAENVSSGIVSAAVPAPIVPSYSSPVDWTDYSGSNLLPYPYSYLGPTNASYTNAGVTYTLRDYGIVITSGGLTSSFSSMYLTHDLVLDPGVYTLSAGGPVRIRAWCKDRSLNTEYALPDGTFEVPVGSNWEIDIYLVVDGSSSINATVYPMLNKGDTAYPYQPYLPYWIQEAYGSGYTSGWNSAYDRGYYQGKDDAYSAIGGTSMSVFDYAEAFTCTLYYNGGPFPDGATTGSYYLGAFIPNRSVGTVSFSYLWEDINRFVNGDWSNIDRVTVTVSWDSNHKWSYGQFPIFAGGNPGFRNARLFTANDSALTLVANTSYDATLWRFDIFDLPPYSTLEVNAIDFYFSDPENTLKNAYLYTETASYNVGYDMGYSEGYNSGVNQNVSSVQQEFYNQGYDYGYSVGKSDGVKIGQNGSFSSLMAAVVDAPVKAITGLLNFEILGQNMLSFLGSLLTLSLVLIFIKKVVL